MGVLWHLHMCGGPVFLPRCCCCFSPSAEQWGLTRSVLLQISSTVLGTSTHLRAKTVPCWGDEDGPHDSEPSDRLLSRRPIPSLFSHRGGLLGSSPISCTMAIKALLVTMNHCPVMRRSKTICTVCITETGPTGQGEKRRVRVHKSPFHLHPPDLTTPVEWFATLAQKSSPALNSVVLERCVSYCRLLLRQEFD